MLSKDNKSNSDKDILFIITSHQVNDDRVNHLVNNLKKIKEQNIDICVTTHCDYGIEKISQYCDYLVYDKDNYYPKLQDILDNLQYIDLNRLKSRFHAYSDLFFNGNKTALSSYFFECHSKSALANFKNGINIAMSRNYKWVVYLEYDIILPNLNLKEYFTNKINELESLDKDGHGYYCEDGRKSLIWPLFFIIKTKIFSDDENFMSNWQESISKYLLTYGNMSFEEIIDSILNRNNFISESAFNINNNMGYSIKDMEELSIFHQRQLPQFTFDLFNFYYTRLFAVKNDDDSYGLEFWFVIKEKVIDETSVRINIFENEKIISDFTIIDTHIPSWRYLPLYENISPFDTRSIKFVVTISFENKEDYVFTYNFKLNQIEKYYHLFNRTIQ